MKMDVNVSLPKAALLAIAVVTVVFVLLLAWIGGEAHYPVERQQSFVAALNPVHLPATVMGSEHDGPDDGIESRGVAAAGIDGDTHRCPSWPP